REARQGSADVRHAHSKEFAAVGVAEPDADGHTEDDGRQQRDEADDQVVAGSGQQQSDIVDQAGEGREDDVHHFLAVGLGVSTRPSSTSRPSSANASSTARAPAPTNWVLNGDDTALMIGDPRPSSTTKAAIVAMLTVSTVAMRTPEMIDGSARGSSTLNSS